MNLQPESFSRRVLLAVTGLSPQVVTETLYALAVQRQPPFVPTEIHLITTREGQERAKLALLSDDPGWFHRFCRDYAMEPADFHIHTLEDAASNSLDDIRTPEDNERSADFITEAVRGFTADANAALHVSIAGGRKTMGYYLGYALSLYGRPQDRLSHVLVSEPFESSWDFAYPTPYSRVISFRDNKLADTADARVTLAEIPFFSLRHGLPENLLQGRGRFTEAVAAVRRSLGPQSLALEPATCRVQAAGQAFNLPPAEFALLALFARRAMANAPALPAPPKEVPCRDWAERYLAEYRPLRGELGDTDTTEKTLRNGMDGDYFSQRLTKLRRLLKQALGVAAGPYLIDDGGHRPRRYRLALPAEAVRFGTVEEEKCREH